MSQRLRRCLSSESRDFHTGICIAPSCRPRRLSFGWGFVTGLGSALFVTLYDYAGYSQIALVGEEVHDPQRTLPLAIVGAILIVLALYLFLQIGVLAAIPWRTLLDPSGHPTAQSQFVGATVVQQAWGARAAIAVTVLILVTAFASLYGNLVGAARVPFAAARDGAFFPWFARLHPTKHFPHVALLGIGAISIAGCFFNLVDVIAVLSAAGILTGNIAQIGALFALRMRGERAPFRMWLYPLPALVALAGWCYAFAGTGLRPIALGIAWLAAGTVSYLLAARNQRAWPFAVSTAAVVAAALFGCAAPARAQEPKTSPFFLYGATFFYERIPRDRWASALQRYRGMGINTIDLYVMWNWHEVREGDFDFTGRTNARRDLVGLLKLIDADGFHIVLRPGPVIRNEWRNGGYPAWLLERPQYHMPLRDVLEGRYPATATLQNERSNSAAQEWLNNPVHMRYATRWLKTVLHAIAPWRQDVFAIALDDDQGAYIDNDTWPGPHFHRYISYLSSVVRGAAPGVPVFINTYDMKVTASAPVWAWGNWYQSDAYSIGEHDRAQLEFTTGLLQTQPHHPVMISEFQAGWLQDADQPAPRPADPSNTTLALHTMLQSGAHGVVNFPVQDTLNPAGWEAPWANAFYSWDAALSVQLTPQARYAPTAQFGALIRRFGSQLAQTHPAADAAIAYLTSAYDSSHLGNDDVANVAQATTIAQKGCRIIRITCSLVDLRYASQRDLYQYPVLILPPNGVRLHYIASVLRKLARFREAGGRIVATARRARIARPAAGGIPNAALLVSSDERYAFLDVVNYGRTALHTHPGSVQAGAFHMSVPPLTIPARDALLLPLRPAMGQAVAATLEHSADFASAAARDRLSLRPGSWIAANLAAQRTARVYRADVYRDGYPAVIFENAAVRLVVSPCAGARAFVLQDAASGRNLFTTVGGLRDAWLHMLPPSPRDYIAKYTHPIATGTFNRCYATQVDARRGSAVFTYDAPDAPPHGAVFRKMIAIDPRDASFTVTLKATFAGSSAQRAQQLTSFAIQKQTRILQTRDAVGFFNPSARRLSFAAWPRGSVAQAVVEHHAADALVILTYAPGGGGPVRYGAVRAQNALQAQARLRNLSNPR